MKILIYSYNYWPEPIGIAPLMTELAEGLVQRGHKLRVITAMPNYPQRKIYADYQGKFFLTEERNGVQIQRSYIWVKPNPGLFDRILLDGSFVITSIFQAIRGWRPDIILYTTPPLPVAVPAACFSFIWNCPVVLNLQDILPDAAVHVGLLSNRLLIGIFTLLEWFAYRTATRITVITNKFTENLITKGVCDHKIKRIPNWVNVEVIKPLPKENTFRQAHKLEGKFVVLYSGNIALTQGLETAIRTATKLQHKPDIIFVIVGESKRLVELQQTCETLGANNVKLLPFQDEAVLPTMLAAADVGLVLQRSNVIAFNMPSKIQKILASGRPIIASVPLNGSAAEVINQSQAGLVVSAEKPTTLAQAILKLYEDSQFAAQLGEQARQFALQHYRYDRVLDDYEQLFRELLSHLPDRGDKDLPPKQSESCKNSQKDSMILQFLNALLSSLGLGNMERS